MNILNINRTVLFSLLSLGLGCSLQSTAQTGTSSPYSQFGAGDIKHNATVEGLAMGGSSIAVNQEKSFSLVNPASYSSLKYTCFQTAAFTSFSDFSDGKNHQYNTNASFSYLSIGFPVSKKMGGAFGLLPYSSSGYRTVSPEMSSEGGGTYHHIFEGRGGVSRFFAGLAYKPQERLSIGINGSYLFGNIQQNRAIEFKDSVIAFNTQAITSTTLGGLNVSYGAQYYWKLQNDKKLTLAYTGSLKTAINATRSTLVERYQSPDGSTIIVVDTIENKVDESGKMILPMYNSIGFSLEKGNQWLFAGEIYSQQWSQYRLFNQNPKLNNTYGLALGLKFTPNSNAVKNYFNLIDYMLGFNYGQSFVNINNSKVYHESVSVGLGIPLIKSGSKVNLAVELSQRGKAENQLVKEQYLSLHLGFTISDKWFKRYKFD